MVGTNVTTQEVELLFCVNKYTKERQTITWNDLRLLDWLTRKENIVPFDDLRSIFVDDTVSISINIIIYGVVMTFD